MLVFASGFVLSLIAVIPPWPVYNKHPIQWLSQNIIVVEEKASTEEPETPTGTYKVEEIELE
ncbi:hypothetical protein BC937DRAFT_86401 [Endogone sp. FLAS-F59071]|nr:hypothetical protein BC937DRAFT_86401 [Endogone sp. FLAS-F59071]|eukprot:RUS13069.1 hypothetical protein BC937DRAFT_86401 [Endogone sp. FLAS-F59071]